MTTAASPRHKRLRIVVLIPQRGAVVRGGESSALGLAAYLMQRHHVTVLGSRRIEKIPWAHVAYREPGKWVTVLFERCPSVVTRVLRRLHLDPGEWERLQFCRRAFGRILAHKPDLLVVRSAGYWGSVLGHLLRCLRNLPFVSITGGWKTSELEQARIVPDLHIAVNPEVAEHLQSRLPDVRVVYLPNGLNISEFTRNASDLDLDMPKPRFLTAGAVLPFKRYHLAIRAVAKLPRGSLLILGEGERELHDSLQELGRRLLGPERFRMAAVAYPKVSGYFKNCDVFTLPSVNESFGMAYIEAMAHNKPVVAPDDASRRIILGNAGLLCNPEDVDAYAAALTQAADTDFGARPQRQAWRFDWSVIGPRYCAVLENTVNQALIAGRPNHGHGLTQ